MGTTTAIPRKRWRYLRRVLLGVVLLPFVLAASGAAYNALSIRHYRSLYPPPGQLFRVNGKEMHLYCTGEGSPTIVLEAGLGGDVMTWSLVQPTLSKTTRVCAYDRIGVGWSEPQDGASDSIAVADRLHALLSQAGVVAPLVLMGHSVAGLHMRVYVDRFPADVVGLVIVDGATPRSVKNAPAELVAMSVNEDNELKVARWKAMFGITRLEDECPRAPPWVDDAQVGWFKATGCVPSQIAAVLAESEAVERSADETASTGTFGDLPILILSADMSRVSPDTPMALLAPGWEAAQEELKHLSTRSRRIIAKGSRHFIQFDRSDLVNREVPDFVERIRTGTPLPETDATVTE